MEIAQFKYAGDNFGYLVFAKTCAIAIDGGDPEGMIAFAEGKGVAITLVTNTHRHPDHTMGNSLLLEGTGAQFIDCRELQDGQTLEFEPGEALEVLMTPGHTRESVCFKGEGFIVTGDTLFNATVGNCFSGDLDAFYHSLKRLMALPPQTQVFAGHDYVTESLAAAWSIEKDNPHIGAYEQKYDSDLVVSSIGDELKVNPYLRFNSPAIIRRLEERKMPRATESQRFSSLMEIY
jgi:hydroxyacylglutathione hydrolase